jgi:periplasmic protein CpxP/Spy
MTRGRSLATWTIVVLVALNLSTIGMIWMREMRPPAGPPGDNRPDEQAVVRFLQSELALSDDQVRQYQQLRQRHAQEIQRLREEIGELKRQQLKAQLDMDIPDMERATQAARRIADNQFELELLTFQHFAELRTLIGHEQVEKLRSLLLELFMVSRSGGQPEPPPPPR